MEENKTENGSMRCAYCGSTSADISSTSLKETPECVEALRSSSMEWMTKISPHKMATAISVLRMNWKLM